MFQCNFVQAVLIGEFRVDHVGRALELPAEVHTWPVRSPVVRFPQYANCSVNPVAEAERSPPDDSGGIDLHLSKRRPWCPQLPNTDG